MAGFPQLRFPALPAQPQLLVLADAVAPPAAGAAAPAATAQPCTEVDGDLVMDFSREFSAIIDVAEEEARLRTRALEFEQAFETRAEERFTHRLSEYEQGVAQHARAEVEATRAESTHALEAIHARGAQLLQVERAACEGRDLGFRRSANEEFERYRAHLMEQFQAGNGDNFEGSAVIICS